MLDEKYLSVLGADSKEQLLSELVRFTRQLGFSTVSATVVLDQAPGSDPRFFWLENVPDAYRGTFSDPLTGKLDPVAQHCKHRATPIVWDQSTYVKAGMGERWEYQAQFGLRFGISWAMHLPAGRHFLIGIDRDQPLPACAGEVSRMTADLQLFTVHAQEIAAKLLLDVPADETPLGNLTERELECLRWTRDGKTAWELGRILGIAEQTAARHLHNASKKLACVSKHQAVLKAMQLRLID